MTASNKLMISSVSFPVDFQSWYLPTMLTIKPNGVKYRLIKNSQTTGRNSIGERATSQEDLADVHGPFFPFQMYFTCAEKSENGDTARAGGTHLIGKCEDMIPD